MSVPVPTTRALGLVALGLVPAALAMLIPSSAWLVSSFDLALLGVIALDFFLAPAPRTLRIERSMEPVFSAGRSNRVQLTLSADRPVRGVLRDAVNAGPIIEGHQQRFAFEGSMRLTWSVRPVTRGVLQFGPIGVRLIGPLGLCARQRTIDLAGTVKVFPDLTVLSRDALELARTHAETSRPVRTRLDGREFESLRDYRQGDDPRTIDWKATARRARPMVRQHQPEQNQQVLILLDCGRHMTGDSEGRPKLDHAVDAALRLARVALERRDLVGVMAFGAEVRTFLPPSREPAQLSRIARSLAEVTASLEESRYGLAFDTAFRRGTRRSLVVLFTDLLDRDAVLELQLRARRLVPRHVLLIVSLQDAGLHALAHHVPADEPGSLERFVARRLEREGAAAAVRLREGGAHVVRETAETLASAGVRAYLDVKQRGLL